MVSKRLSCQSAYLGSVVGWLLLILVGEVSLLAQLTTGTILGTVKDQTEAVLPRVSVRVINVETDIVRTAETGSRGEYRVSNLPPGNYEVQVSLAGFQSSVRRGIPLSVGREAVLDFTLPVGEVTEQVTVTGEAPIIETTTATVSGLVDPKQMRDIPLNARSFIEMVPLQAGAVFAESGGRSATQGLGKKLSIVGARFNTNSFLLDGADMNDSSNSAGSAAGTLAGVETIREFRVVTNAYDAEYGRHAGGVISAITKSGTNGLHGSLFEFLRNSKLDARNFFDKQIPPFKRNQFGGAVGGPIRKDKTFFFGSYEGLRERLGLTLTSIVPGVGMRNGFLRGAFVGIHSEVKPYLEAFPVPNAPDRPDGTASYSNPYSRRTNQNFGTARIDHRFSDADSFFGRFTIDNAEQLTPLTSGANTAEQSRTGNRFSTMEETHIFSPALLSRTHFSFNRTNINVFDIGMAGFIFPKFSFSDVADAPGRITVAGLSQWGGASTNPKVLIQNTFQFKEDIFFTRGRHYLKFGGQGERFQFNQRSDARTGGEFTFASLADFLRNDVSSAIFIKPGSDSIRAWRQTVTGLYLHDDISVRPGLSLNLGLRYEFITVPTEANGKVANIRNLSPQHFYSVSSEQTDVGDPYFLNPSLLNFAPRVGFAWAPFQNGKTSLRGGFGMYHDQIMTNAMQTTGVRLAPFFSVAEMFSERLAALGQSIDFPNAYFSQRSLLEQSIGSVPQADGFVWNAAQPTVMKWSLDMEQQIAPDTTLEAGYSGTRGVHLLRGNLRLNTTPAEIRDGRRFILITQPLPNPNWSRMRWIFTNGTSQYHSFRLTVKKRFSRGLQFQSAYTFSKSTDTGSSHGGSTDFGVADQTGYRGEKSNALSSFDVRDSFYTSFVYELPGRNGTGAAGKLLSGWSLSSILRFNSGNPVNLAADQPRQGTFQMREVDGSTVDLIPGGNQNPVRPENPNQYFDVTQFSFPTPFFQGNLGRNVLITPGIANVDATVIKETKISWLGENTNLQFRAEFFNLFNRPNFGVPALSVFDRNGLRKSNAGEITDTRTTSRQIQFALRLAF